MKDKEKKNKKHHESTIGKIIYGFLLFLPLLAIGVTCGYAIFNKNAYQSYYGETINEENNNYLTSNEQISSDNVYYYDSSKALNTEYSGTIYFTTCEYVLSSSTLTNEQLEIINNSVRLYFYRGTSTTFYTSDNTTQIVSGLIQVKVSGVSNTNIASHGYDVLYYKTYNTNSFVSEAFYYSVDKVTQSNLFNWTQYTSIYTTINQFTNNLGITNTFMPLLLTYWLIISIVYFLYDIVLMILVVLHRKIHELQNTI